jgi:hypothetical protein
MEDALFVRHFVLATWWVGAVGGGALLWRLTGRWPDAVCGTVAGAGAGILGSATLACLVPLLDLLPWLGWSLLARVAGRGGLVDAVWLWTPLWIVTAALGWGLLGGGVGVLLTLGGERGRRLLARLAVPVTWFTGSWGALLNRGTA